MKHSRHLDDRKPVIEVVDPLMAEVLRKKTEGERLAISWSMWEFARELIDSSLRSEHPQWTHAQIRRETARRLAHEPR